MTSETFALQTLEKALAKLDALRGEIAWSIKAVKGELGVEPKPKDVPTKIAGLPNGEKGEKWEKGNHLYPKTVIPL